MLNNARGRNLKAPSTGVAAAVCIVVMLAAGGMAIANFAIQHQDTQLQPKVIKRQLTEWMDRDDVLKLIANLTEDLRVSQLQLKEMIMERNVMKIQITKLTQDLDVTQSQLSEIVLGENITRGLPGKKHVYQIQREGGRTGGRGD